VSWSQVGEIIIIFYLQSAFSAFLHRKIPTRLTLR